MINWDDYFLSLAFLIAQKSKDPSTVHGSVIVDSEKRIVATGFNGAPSGMDDSKVPYDTSEKYNYICHSETNAILFAKQNLSGCTLYVTGEPCSKCMLQIAQSGIKKVIYGGIKSKMIDSVMSEITYRIAMESGIEMIEHQDKIKLEDILEKALSYLRERG